MVELFAHQAPTLGQMIASVERELRLRRQVYPRRTAEGKMRDETARHEIACMEGVLALLQERKGTT